MKIMNYISRALAAVLFFCLASAHVAGAQHVSIPSSKLESSDPRVRADGFFEIIAAAETNHAAEKAVVGAPRGPRTDLLASDARHQDDLSLALIKLLEKESAYRDQSHGSLPPDWADGYYAYLADAVAMLGDKRAAKALVGAMNLGYDEIHAAAGLGTAAVPELLRALRQGPNQLGAAIALGVMMADRAKLDVGSGTLESVKSALLSVIRAEGDYITRAESIEALWTVDGADILATMESISAHEPPAIGSGRVQRAANKWLEKHPR
jgi:hypothetical protein